MVSSGFEAGVYPHLYTEMVSQKPGYQANLVNKSFLAVKKASDYNKNKMRDIILRHAVIWRLS